MISLEFYSLLKNQIKTSEVVRHKVNLINKGKEYSGLCPFHNEKTPSFTVNDSKKFYHCFGCGAHGDVIKFTSEIFGIKYKEAAIKLAGEYNIEIPKATKEQQQEYDKYQNIINILEIANKFFVDNIHDNNEVLSYLNNRNITADIINKFEIGYAPYSKNKSLIKHLESKNFALKDLIGCGLVAKDHNSGRIYEIFNNRIMFPIKNIYNQTVAFGGRAVNNNVQPKYLNSQETIVFKKKSTLYGENICTSSAYKNDYAILVEGYIDVIVMHQYGFNMTAATLGTAVTEGQLNKIWSSCKEIIICLDGDNAGIKAAEKVINNAIGNINHEKKISFVNLPNNMDPDDFLQKYQKHSMDKLLENRISLSEFIWMKELNKKPIKTAEDKANLQQNLYKYLDDINDIILKNNFKQYYNNMLWGLNKKKKNYYNKQDNLLQNLELLNNNAELSEAEKIALNILYLISYNVVLLDKQDILDNFDNLLFGNKIFMEYKNWLIDNKNQIQTINLQEKLYNGKFKYIFTAFTQNNLNLIFKIDQNNKINLNNINILNKISEIKISNYMELIYNLLTTKYYLLSIKEEYDNLIKNYKLNKTADIENNFLTKITFYNQEISKTRKIIAESEKIIAFNM